MNPTKVLQIGINYAGTDCALNGCINDVRHINEFIREEFDCTRTQFRLLTDDNTAALPTRDNILAGIQWLVFGATGDSFLMLHYSGHGSRTLGTNPLEADGKDECICPSDDTRIIDDELRTLLIESLPRGCKLFALFDCCHSGTMLDLKYSYGITEHTVNAPWRADNNCTATRANVMMISGCMDSQVSIDAFEAGTYQGAMTYALLATVRHMKTTGEPLQYGRVMSNMLGFLKARSYAQIPQFSSGRLVDLRDVMW